MSRTCPRVTHLTKSSGKREDWPIDAIMGLICVSDVWPGDMFVVPGGLILELEGNANWRIVDTLNGEILRTRAPGYISK